MPPDHRLGLDDGDGLRPAVPQAGEQDPEQPVGGPQAWTRRAAPEDDQLMPQREVLEHQGALGPDPAEEADEGADEAARAATRGKIAAALDARIPVLVLFWGDPAPFVDPAHAAGTKLVVQVGSAEEAAAAARAGVDAIIAQGVEAGGHVRAVDSIWDVLPRAVEVARGVPVLAAGGITDGTSIARALRMGAQGVSLGTRFVASTEAWVHERYKERLVEATASDTVFGLIFTVGWPDAPHRALRNRTVLAWEAAGSPPEGSRPGEGEVIGTRHEPWGDFPMRRYEVGMVTPTFEGAVELAVMWAGQSVDGVRSVCPAAEIVASLVADAEKALAKGC